MSDSVNLSRDIDAAPELFEGVSEVERLTDGPYRVGTRWRETREVLGQSVTAESEVVASEALGLTTVRTHVSGTDYTTTYKLTANHPGTTLSASVDGAAEEEAGVLKRLASKVTGAVAGKALHSSTEKNLEAIARAAEGRSELSPGAEA